ncbi:hypothetical protein IMG5_192880 [Ichthyophthirius multifiliis]|uniref:Glucokinase n=1 Tax=Ichthyophthirius multifiliis TaxID=5932 RepID=G0R4I2_ICHMU|nr:hypothetical protein IMG5_192880 [Ichthyophthirius multifiliis]EGR27633.1 hypothetical protein IMG5_192880 [Ichthyophthirius multifiliis]|eukprot:XP_004025085.1 hypothetical protein IMG5_192880 [Ichthyophthirius multifiliis]
MLLTGQKQQVKQKFPINKYIYKLGNDLAKQFNMKKFQLFNDFEIASYACLNLNETELIQINDAQPINNKIKSVCGPGTGLGVSMIVPHQKYQGSDEYVYQVWPGEGGHCSFPAVTQLQQEFHEFLLQYHNDKTAIALEYVFAGPCIPFMYQFFKLKYPDAELVCENNEGENLFDLDNYLKKVHSSDSKERETAHFPSHRIIQYGVNEEDQICHEVVKLFISIYENAIGDIAIRTLSYSGIYLVGSMTIAILPYLLKNRKQFMKEYIDNRPYLKNIFSKIPIYVVRNVEMGLDGAFFVTKQMAINSE